MRRPEKPEEHVRRPDRSLYAVIGQVAGGWSVLESLVDETIWKLAGVTPEVGACLTAHLQSVNRKMQSLIALARLKGADEKMVKELNKLSRRLDDLARRRNRVVHDTWVIGKGSKHPYRLNATADRQLDLSYKPESLAELRKLRDEMRAVHTGLVVTSIFVTDLGNGSSPDKR